MAEEKRVCTIDTGGPAFNEECISPGNWHRGMTLMDYFAGQAMQAMVSNYWFSSLDDDSEEGEHCRSCGPGGSYLENGPGDFAEIATVAYNQAAAMIAEKRRRESAK